MSITITATDQNFDSIISESAPTVVDFWAPWCGPCKMISPVLDELAVEYEGRVRVAKVNVDENRNAASKAGVQGLPTLVAYRNGEVVERTMGFSSKEKIRSFFEQLASTQA